MRRIRGKVLDNSTREARNEKERKIGGEGTRAEEWLGGTFFKRTGSHESRKKEGWVVS